VSWDRHAKLTIRNLTAHPRRFIERSTMSVIRIRRTAKIRTRNKGSTTRRSFRELTRSYFASERSWEIAIEVLLFAIMVAISTWQMWIAVDSLNAAHGSLRRPQQAKLSQT